MHIILFLGLFALVSTVLADVTYTVIGFPDVATNTFAVEINKKRYPLKTSEATLPLWSAQVANVSASSGYRYVQLDRLNRVIAREKFLRHFTDRAATATVNEVFNRPTTITTLPPVKQVYEDIRPEPSRAFDSSQIATIHLTPDPATFANMAQHPMDRKLKDIKAGFKFINADTVYSAEEVEIKTSGQASRKYQKVSMRIKFNSKKGETFFNRPIIKLRAEYVEPSVIREKLYIDILNSVGVATYQGNYVRVFVNGKPHGLYLMVEDIEEPFLMHTIHRGAIKSKKELGELYQMGSGFEASMVYNGSHTADYGKIYQQKIRGDNPKDEPMKNFIAFMKDLHEWNPDQAGGVAYWNKRLDLDGYLRSMAVEYLAGAWDAAWWRGHNYFMYFNTQRKVWQFIPTDFDHTFSTGNRPGVETTYKKYNQGQVKGKFTDHPLVTKLIYRNKDINKRFEDILLTITEGIFNNEALDPLIDAYARQIELDVAWEFSIDRSDIPGRRHAWTMSDFHNSLTRPVKNVKNGLKPWITNRAQSVPKQVGKSNVNDP
ncbi:hypothetical protein KVV02_002139 [Mortierella alpina]|uniref:Uncharacterized protein n=1 Tax=Mortierella alpina TaxID=64518 RepID=A0A9P8CV64_MORAP|nr:hypothetical protein KVV02_002139 [Mortierella alpina]